jgi:hypothetical protein
MADGGSSMPPSRRRPDDLAMVIRHGDAVADHVRSVVGKSVQLRIPLRDPVDLRRCAEILRQFANRMDVAARNQHQDAGTIMLSVWAEARTAQARLQSHPPSVRKNDGK